MNKVFLIIKREYLSRVKKRSFLIATLLIPILLPAILGGVIYLTVREDSNREDRIIQYHDENNLLPLEDSSPFIFKKVKEPVDISLENFKASNNFGLLIIENLDNLEFDLHTQSNMSISDQRDLERILERTIRRNNIDRLQLSDETVAAINPNVEFRTFNVVSDQESSSGIAFGIGYVGGLLIYMFILIYGSQVMLGVIEEKSSKIVEILIAMVRPFQLMIGKIIGIASVGLTQFVLWVVLMGTLSTIIFNLLGFTGSSEAMAQNPGESAEVVQMIQNIPFLPIILLFIFYFIGGYLLYGSLFAAVGSAVEHQTEAQQFTFPITLPLIASIVGLSLVLNNPNGPAAFWLSMIPLTSPVSMIARIGFGFPPWWQLLLSMSLLIGGFFLTTWIASRIYRIGILSQGAKINFKILFRWFMQRH